MKTLIKTHIKTNLGEHLQLRTRLTIPLMLIGIICAAAFGLNNYTLFGMVLFSVVALIANVALRDPSSWPTPSTMNRFLSLWCLQVTYWVAMACLVPL